MAETTSDKNYVSHDDLLQSFGQTAPGGNRHVRGSKVPKISAETIYCSGDMAIYGAVRTLLRLTKGISLLESGPGIVFGDGLSIHREDNHIVITVDGETVIQIGDEMIVDIPITTSSGDLVLDSASGFIDFSGNTLTNAGGITVSVGDPNDVIINNNLGVLSSEHQLAPVRGGTGIDTSASTGIAKVSSGTWSIGSITGADLGTIDNLMATIVTTGTITSAGDLAITPAGGDVNFGPTVIHQSPGVGSDSRSYTATVTTTNATTTTLFTFPTTSKNAYNFRGLVSLGDTTQGSNTATYNFILKGKNVSGAVSVGGPAQIGLISDGDLNTTNISATTSGANILVQVTGIAARNIQWAGQFDVLIQQF